MVGKRKRFILGASGIGVSRLHAGSKYCWRRHKLSEYTLSSQRSTALRTKSGKQAVIPADLVHDQSSELVLELLERVFLLLVLLNDAFYIMYPPQRHCCRQKLPRPQQDHKCPTVAGQGERLGFVGMLLRTVDQIRWLSTDHKDGKMVEEKLRNAKCYYREYAHGIAALHFLIAGVYQPWVDHNSLVLLYFLHLVHEMKEAGKRCRHLHSPIKLSEFYTEKSRNCTLNVVSHLLNRCESCASTDGVTRFKEKLRIDLDPSNWHGCSDCESMLVDTLVYTTMLRKTNRRMLASLSLSFDYDIDVSAITDSDQGPEATATKILFQLGYSEVRLDGEVLKKGKYDSLYKVSMDYELLFISGREVDKNNLNCLVMEGFLKRKEKRPFFILCDHQLQQYDKNRKCCEPQIKKHVRKLIRKFYKAYQPSSALLTVTATLILEQDSCKKCEEKKHILAIKDQLKPYGVPVQHVTMLPYIPSSWFLHRLTTCDGPVRLLRNLVPEETECMGVASECKHYRCGHKRGCYYSKPGNVLAVDDKKLRYS